MCKQDRAPDQHNPLVTSRSSRLLSQNGGERQRDHGRRRPTASRSDDQRRVVDLHSTDAAHSVDPALRAAVTVRKHMASSKNYPTSVTIAVRRTANEPIICWTRDHNDAFAPSPAAAVPTPQNSACKRMPSPQLWCARRSRVNLVTKSAQTKSMEPVEFLRTGVTNAGPSSPPGATT